MPYADDHERIMYSMMWYHLNKEKHLYNMKIYYIKNKNEILKKRKEAYQQKPKRKTK